MEALVAQWKLIALAVAICGALYGAYHHGTSVSDAEWQGKWNDRDTRDAKAQAAAELQARTVEQDRQTAAEVQNRETEQKLQAAESGRVAAAGDSQRLRDQLAQLQTRLGGTGANPGAKLDSAATTRAAMVLSDLLGSCSKQRQELAGAFDSSRLRGLACEAQYDGIQRGR